MAHGTCCLCWLLSSCAWTLPSESLGWNTAASPSDLSWPLPHTLQSPLLLGRQSSGHSKPPRLLSSNYTLVFPSEGGHELVFLGETQGHLLWEPLLHLSWRYSPVPNSIILWNLCHSSCHMKLWIFKKQAHLPYPLETFLKAGTKRHSSPDTWFNGCLHLLA